MSHPDKTIDFSGIDELIGGYRAARILMAATELGVFEALEQGALSANDLASRLEADGRAMRILCDAVTALGLLEKQGGRYRNTGSASRFLVPSSPESRVASVGHAAVLYRQWGRLSEVVRRGHGVREDEFSPPIRRDKQAFAAAMADIGRTSAVQTAAKLDLEGVATLLDIGGGPGLYATEFARRNSILKVTILDDAETLGAARRNVSAAGLVERVTFRCGDAFSDDLGGPYDCIFISNMVHIYGMEENRRLVGRCASALASGGRLVIKDFRLEEDRAAPVGSALFAVNMLVNTDRGDCYTSGEIAGWMADAGLRFEGVAKVTDLSSLFVGRRG